MVDGLLFEIADQCWDIFFPERRGAAGPLPLRGTPRSPTTALYPVVFLQTLYYL